MIVAPDAETPDADTAEMTGFTTVTATLGPVTVRPARSVATAASECWPLETLVVSHDHAKGEAVIFPPRLLPSSLYCTLAMPAGAEAVAVIRTVPETVVPETGVLIATES